PPRLGASSKSDVIAVFDERWAEFAAAPRHDLKQVLGNARFVQYLGDEQRRVGRLLGGFEHDGVAREQRGDGVGDDEREWVVPRRDDADDADGMVVFPR